MTVELRDIISVSLTKTPGVFGVACEARIEGVDEFIAKHIYRPDDPYGLSPQIKEWLAERPDFPIKPYVPPQPPTPEELRARMEPLTRRQLLRTLWEIGIAETDIDAKLANDAVGLIEWRNANTFARLHPLIISVASDLNLPPEQVDSLWDFALTF